MNIIKRWLPEDEVVPAWARQYSEERFRYFLATLEEDLDARSLPYRLDAEAGVLEVELPGADRQQLQLVGLADGCRRIPRREWPDYIERHLNASISVLVGGMAAVERLGEEFHRAAPLLKLRFYPEEYLDEKVPMVYQRLAEGLVLVLVYDLPQSIATVPPDHLTAWDRSAEDVFQLALQNVRDLGKLEHTSIDLPEGTTLEFLTDQRHSFAATQVLCLPEYLKTLPPHGVLVSIPGGGQVIFHRIESLQVMAALNTMLRTVPEVYLEAPRGISPDVYWWRDGGFTLLPVSREDGRIDFRPPAEFMAMLGTLKEQRDPEGY